MGSGIAQEKEKKLMPNHGTREGEGNIEDNYAKHVASRNVEENYAKETAKARHSEKQREIIPRRWQPEDIQNSKGKNDAWPRTSEE